MLCYLCRESDHSVIAYNSELQGWWMQHQKDDAERGEFANEPFRVAAITAIDQLVVEQSDHRRVRDQLSTIRGKLANRDKEISNLKLHIQRLNQKLGAATMKVDQFGACHKQHKEQIKKLMAECRSVRDELYEARRTRQGGEETWETKFDIDDGSDF